VGRWETTNQGEYLAVGVGTAIAGFRADLGLIDDPIRSKEDANSKLIRDKHWDWYNFDFKTRSKPNAAYVFIYTPWHEDDLGHRILAAEGPEWTVLRMPFYAEENDPLGRAPREMLWSEWYKPEMFPKDARVASALYQLRPSPEEGDFFKKDWLVEYKHSTDVPEGRHYSVSDHAVSLKQEADPTLLVNFVVDEKEDIWIKDDFFWERANTLVVCNQMLSMAEGHRPVCWFAGKEHITASIGPFLHKLQQERGVYFTIEESVSKRDKPTRCQAIRGRMALGKVHFPAYHRRYHEIKHEILSFPVGTHDEWPDCLGEIGRGLQSLTRHFLPKENEKEFGSVPFVPTLSWIKESSGRTERTGTERYGGR